MFIISCDRVTPGGIWDKFEPELRLEKKSDQGPWGGTRSYFWRSQNAGHFNKIQITNFALTNGWTLVDSISYKAEEFKNITKDNNASFIIRVGPFEPSSEENFLEYNLPRWTSSDLTLYKFKTNWLIFSPGTENSTEINGFILISKDGKEMTVYHLWGD